MQSVTPAMAPKIPNYTAGKGLAEKAEGFPWGWPSALHPMGPEELSFPEGEINILSALAGPRIQAPTPYPPSVPPIFWVGCKHKINSSRMGEVDGLN